VAGEWDLAAVVRVGKNEDLADLVTARLLKLDAILKSTTLIAFRAYSNYDLERMFSIGFEEEG
jgi:DNA-binding Lrp family transcriptional regulator